MLQSELSERFWPAAPFVPRHDRTLEVERPRTGALPVRLSEVNAQLVALAPGELITVRTGNSLYHLIVLDPLGRKVLVQGGRYFPCTTEACLLEGSSVPELLLDAVAARCSLQFVVGNRCFMTSPIVEVEREVRAA